MLVVVMDFSAVSLSLYLLPLLVGEPTFRCIGSFYVVRCFAVAKTLCAEKNVEINKLCNFNAPLKQVAGRSLKSTNCAGF